MANAKHKDAAFQDWVCNLDWSSFTLEFEAENDLLRQMVQLQLPLPTPLHPRAIPNHASREETPAAWFHQERNSRREKQRLLKLVETCESERALEFKAFPLENKFRKKDTRRKGHKGARTRRTVRVGVIARQFRMADGTILSRPSLQKRIDMDELLVSRSQLVLQKGSDVVSEPCYTCRLNWNTSMSESCSLLDLLTITSSGNFGRRPFYADRSDSCFFLTAKTWLDPFERWFSLAQYLAFCYEVSLRNMFHESKRGPVRSISTKSDEFRAGMDEGEFWPEVISRALRQVMKNEDQTALPFIRDTLLASCLLDTIDAPFRKHDHPSNFFCFPLVDLGSPICRWKNVVHEKWLMVRSLRAEAALMKDNEMSDDTNVMTNTSLEMKSSVAKKVKRKKTKRRTSSQNDRERKNVDNIPQSRLLENSHEINGKGDRTANEKDSFQAFTKQTPPVSEGDAEDTEGFQVVRKGKRTAGKIPTRSNKPKEPYFCRDKSVMNANRQVANDSTSANVDSVSPNTTDNSLFPSLRNFSPNNVNPDPSATLRVSNTTSHREQFSGDFALSEILPGYGGDRWILTDFSHFGIGGGWHREVGESMLTELLDSQNQFERTEGRVASSTAASTASSLKDETAEVHLSVAANLSQPTERPATSELDSASNQYSEVEDAVFKSTKTKIVDTVPNQSTRHYSVMSEMSPSPPSTPSPTLSPILVSLSELSTMDKRSIPNFELGHSSLCSDPTARKESIDRSGSNTGKSYGSKPFPETNYSHQHDFNDSTTGASRSFHTRSLRARDDGDIHSLAPRSTRSGSIPMFRGPILRSESARDDTEVTGRLRANLQNNDSGKTSRGVSCQSPTRPPRYFQIDTNLNCMSNDRMCTSRSETALENGETESNDWHSKTRELDDVENSTTVSPRDGLLTNNGDDACQEDGVQLKILREEKNMFQDMCLHLGAEVAKLRSIVAAQAGIFAPSSGMIGFPPNTRYPLTNEQQFDFPFISESFPMVPRARTLMAMSDAGNRADNESMAGNDDNVAGTLQTQDARQLSSAATVAESDVSLDPSTVYNTYQMPIGIRSVREIHEPIGANGVRSRLSNDIIRFLNDIESKLSQFESKRRMTIERMTRLVKSVWPRAQVNVYGSHATGLCVPTSDIDFVVCLPAVHKNAVAVAPGVLEGRNAINESSQKILARRLKGESWIDPRSMKIIERTTTPVIKVATKDIKAKALHLDISFEAPGHHGLEAARMIKSVIEEIPHVRPLCLVLKQFLIDRGLLEAYTGGLSSYCLFLMVTRYLQEQNNLDVGSLLMGFLDFYGNHFDFAATGISIRHRQYFPRPSYYAAVGNYQNLNSWRPPNNPAATGETQMLNAGHRRKSFSDHKNINGMRNHKRNNISVAGVKQGSTAGSDHGFGHGFSNAVQHAALHPQQSVPSMEGSQAMPYTFDPLFVEDPLSDGNNVGRNAFRIFQIQRAFSDAHRALVAALEWDMQSANEEARALPLLKCLFQNEEQAHNSL